MATIAERHIVLFFYSPNGFTCTEMHPIWADAWLQHPVEDDKMINKYVLLEAERVWKECCCFACFIVNVVYEGDPQHFSSTCWLGSPV